MLRVAFPPNSRTVRYLGAVAWAAASLLLWWAVNLLFARRLGFTVVFPAMVAATRLFGIGPGIVTAVLGAAGIVALAGTRDPFLLCIYLALSALAIYVSGAWGRAHRHATETEAMAAERLQALSQEEAAARLREERLSAQLRAIVESSADAVISKDLDGRIQSWNRAAEEIFGYSAAEVIGQPSPIVPGTRRHEEAEVLAHIRRGGSMKQFETERVRKDGRTIQVSVTISPIHSASGEVVGVSQIARDISEQKSFEAQLRQTQKLESLGVMAGGMAHDFNNLLTDIMGNAGLMMEELPPESHARARVGEIVAASQRAALLIRQMLAYAGKGQFVVEKLDLSAQVAEIVSLLKGSFPRRIDFQLHLEQHLPPIEADRSQIQQLIMNLGLNAAEALEGKRGTVSMATSSRRNCEGVEVLLEVADTGCGIAETDRERIFDPFFTTKFTGRGLGLAAVMGIIRAHGGSISVDSIPGRGSKFMVIFPAPAAGVNGRALPEAEAAGSSSAP